MHNISHSESFTAENDMHCLRTSARMNDTSTGKPSPVFTALFLIVIVLKPVSHPHEVADSCLYSGHGRTEVGNRFAINFSLLMHDDQVRYLLSHRLQDTLNGFRVKHRHRGIATRFSTLTGKNGARLSLTIHPVFASRTTLRPVQSPGFSPSCGNHEIPGSPLLLYTLTASEATGPPAE